MCDTRNLGRSNIRRQEQGILNCDKNGVIKLQWKGIKKTKKPAEGTKKPIEVDKTKNQNQQDQYPEHLSGVSGMTNFTPKTHTQFILSLKPPQTVIFHTRKGSMAWEAQDWGAVTVIFQYLSIFIHFLPFRFISSSVAFLLLQSM